MKLLSAAALAFLAAVPPLAPAQTVLVDFEKSWPFGAEVQGYYAGGSASDGMTGANLGVSFVNVSGLSNDAFFTYYSGAPSPLGIAYAFTSAPGDHAYMNMAVGAAGALSFFYSNPSVATIPSAIVAYSGLNGTGTQLGSISLANDDSGDYSGWRAASFSFSGIARSFDLTATADIVALDNITVTAVPEPSSLALLLLGGVAVVRQLKRRQV